MTTWTASPRCISMNDGGQHRLIASAPYGMAGTKEWAERAALMAAAPAMIKVLRAFLDEQANHQGLVSTDTYAAAHAIAERLTGIEP